MMKFAKECGVIVSSTNKALRYIEGEPTKVEFPEEIIWEIHKSSPGSIYKLAHTHPEGVTEPSARDLLTLKTWAFAMYPFPARMSIIYYNDKSEMFTEKVFVAHLQPKGEWLAQGKGVRELKIFLEFVTTIASDDRVVPWEEWLINKTYE